MMKYTGVLMIGVVVVLAALVFLAVTTSGYAQALTMGFGALVGLSGIALAQYLKTREALTKARKERLQEARGLARALAEPRHYSPPRQTNVPRASSPPSSSG